MKIVSWIFVLSILLLSGAAFAEDASDKAPAVVGQAEKAGVIHHLNTGAGDDSNEPAERPEDYEGQALPSYESYDPNTGLTDNTQSDAVGNLN